MIKMQNSHLLKNKDIFDYLSSVFSGDVERISDYTDDVNRENIKKEVMAMTGLGESIRKKAIAEGKAEGKIEGELKILNELVQDGIMTLDEAAKRVHMTVDEFLQKLNAILEHDDK